MKLLGFSTNNCSFNVVFKNNKIKKSKTSDFIDHVQVSKMYDNLDKKLNSDVFQKTLK